MIAALIACVAGFAVFLALAFRVAGGSRRGGDGSIADGKRVKYSAVSHDENGKETHDTSQAAPQALPASDDVFVRVTDYVPGIRVNLKYAGKNNFTGRQLYDFKDAYLRYGTVKKLGKAQAELEKSGMGLAIWDAFRPKEAQRQLWEVCPNPLYVTDPSKGNSTHTRGNAVDVTLVDSDGTEMLMPTELDNFTKLADRDYSDIDNSFARDNAKLLEKVMKKSGFEPYSEEWWHFTDTQEYPVSEDFVPPSG